VAAVAAVGNRVRAEECLAVSSNKVGYSVAVSRVNLLEVGSSEDSQLTNPSNSSASRVDHCLASRELGAAFSVRRHLNLSSNNRVSYLAIQLQIKDSSKDPI